MNSANSLLWPHENKRLLFERARRVTHSGARSLGKRLRRKYLIVWQVLRALFALYVTGNLGKTEEEIMYLFNGRPAKVLADKYKFLELAAKLGYQIPRQLLILKESPAQERLKRFDRIFPEGLEGFYFKPLNAYGGHGINIFQRRDEAKKFLETVGSDYIVEEAMKIDTEFRYIRYVDPDGNFWRMAFEKARPTVVGDGHSLVWQLLWRARRIPVKSKEIVTSKRFFDLLKVLPKGERLQLATMGFPQEGAFGRLPSEGEIAALDLFMARFIKDLERGVGSFLPLLCFDIGVLTALGKEMDFKECKQAIVPFECQMPFAPGSYFKFIPDKLRTFYLFYEMLFKDMLSKVDVRLEKEETKRHRSYA